MGAKFSVIITDFLYNQGAIKDEEKEIYLYGFECFILSFFQTVILLTIGVITNSIIETIVFVFVFALVRRYAGGYHAETQIACTVWTSVMLIGTISFHKLVQIEQMKYLMYLMMVFNIIIILLYAPIKNERKPINQIQIGENRRKAIICSVILTVLALLLSKLFSDITIDIVLSQFMVAVMMIISVLRREEDEYEEIS